MAITPAASWPGMWWAMIDSTVNLIGSFVGNVTKSAGMPSAFCRSGIAHSQCGYVLAHDPQTITTSPAAALGCDMSHPMAHRPSVPLGPGPRQVLLSCPISAIVQVSRFYPSPMACQKKKKGVQWDQRKQKPVYLYFAG